MVPRERRLDSRREMVSKRLMRLAFYDVSRFPTPTVRLRAMASPSSDSIAFLSSALREKEVPITPQRTRLPLRP